MLGEAPSGSLTSQARARIAMGGESLRWHKVPYPALHRSVTDALPRAVPMLNM